MTHHQDGGAAYHLPDETILQRIDKALADWYDEGRARPDTIYLGMRDCFSLDRALGEFSTTYKGMRVMLSNQVSGISLARVY